MGLGLPGLVLPGVGALLLFLPGTFPHSSFTQGHSVPQPPLPAALSVLSWGLQAAGSFLRWGQPTSFFQKGLLPPLLPTSLPLRFPQTRGFFPASKSVHPLRAFSDVRSPRPRTHLSSIRTPADPQTSAHTPFPLRSRVPRMQTHPRS